MSLTLVLGPANSGKVRLLLDRFLEAVERGRQPFLVVPTVPDVEIYERELLAGNAALLGGLVGTFDDLFEAVLERCAEPTGSLSVLQRRRVLADVVAAADLDELASASRFPGFVDGLGRVLDDLAASAEPAEVERRLAAPAGGRHDAIAAVRRGYLERLAQLGRRDRAGSRARAAELLAGRLDAWDGSPVLAYGFEDVTGVQLAALRALSANCEVTVSLPYETGRDAYAAVRPVVEALTALPHELVELPPTRHVESDTLAFLERSLFSERAPGPPPADDGSLVLLEACGLRGVADQVAAEALALVRGGMLPEQIAVVVPDVRPWRLPVESAFAACALPVELDDRIELGATAFGQALLELLRFAWFDGDRSSLFRFLRSPFSGIGRRSVDWGEGRLRGRGVTGGEETLASLIEMEYPRLVFAAERLAAAEDPVAAVAELVGRMSAAVGGLSARRHEEPVRRHLAAARAVLRALEELSELTALGMPAPDRSALMDDLQRVPVRQGSSGAAVGRVAVLDLRRVRTRRFQAVFILGLEEGILPRGARENAFLDSAEAEQLGIARLDPAQRDRHLFAVAVTRPWQKLFLCRQAATEDGVLRERSPFLDEVARVLGDQAPAPVRRALGDLTWPMEDAPTDRERLRALARELRERPAWAMSAAGLREGWSRKLDRARTAYSRRTDLRHPAVLQALAEQTRFSVTELEKFADCSSVWFVERFLSPGEIDYEFGAKERGSVAHTALHRFYDRLPRELGVERLEEASLERAYLLMRDCLADALRTVRVPSTPAGKQTVRALERDLAGYLRAEAALASPMVPSQFEVRFGTTTSAPGLKDGLKLDGFAASGTIDRIDKDPLLSARGIVWDYKSGKNVPSGAQIESKSRLQIPLYILAARELLGVEPVAGLYRALAGGRSARGIAVKGEIAGLASNDELDETEFWAKVDWAVARANVIVQRIRAGDVRHDPAEGSCPDWCVRRVGGICRVERS